MLADERTQPEKERERQNSFINSCLILDQATSSSSTHTANSTGQQARPRTSEERRQKNEAKTATDICCEIWGKSEFGIE